jgi:hypothetical protein
MVVGLVHSGGLLGFGETARAIPATSFHYNETERMLILNASQRTFRQAPAFDASHINDLAQLASAYRQFGLEPYWMAGGTRQVPETPGAGAGAVAGATPANLRKATQIIGMTVHDSSDRALGEIRDLVLDLRWGRVLYAVLGRGGLLDGDEVAFLIPPQTFIFNDNLKSAILSAPRDRLEHAPHFTKGHWPNLSDPLGAAEVYIYYHAPAYWLPVHAEPHDGTADRMRQPVRETDDQSAQRETAPALTLVGKVTLALLVDPVLARLADAIQITEEGGVVTLQGEVDTAEQKEAVASASRTAVGTTQVQDQITVRK